MARLLPTQTDVTTGEESDPRVVGLDSEAADDLIAALSSDTARELLGELHEEPATPSELADRADTSLQNVQYHLENLEDCGAVEGVDTVYSEKGREMTVYAPADSPLVVVAGGQEETSTLRTVLAGLVGGIGGLAILGGLLNYATGNGFLGTQQDETAGGPTETGGISTMDAATPAEAGGSGVPIDLAAPGTLFFFGGLTVLVVIVLLLVVRRS